LSAPTDKLLVFLTEGPEGWDTPIADLVAACGDMGQPAMLIDLTKPDASAQLNKAASAGVTAFVSMEGVGARMTANGRSIYELLQTPLLTFLPDHPCFYAPLLTTPQKLVVPMFFSQEHVTAARGIYGNVPLAPIVEPWGPRTLELEGEPVPAVFIDASMFEIAKALESQHARIQQLVGDICREMHGTENYDQLTQETTSDYARGYAMWCEGFRRAPHPNALGEGPFAALVRLFDIRFLPLEALSIQQRVRLLQFVVAFELMSAARGRLQSPDTCVFGSGWGPASGTEVNLARVGQIPDLTRLAGDFDTVSSQLLRRRCELRTSRQLDGHLSASAIAKVTQAAHSALFLDIALPGLR
jgi:hypothetical protein